MNRLPKTLIALSFGCAAASGLRLFTGSWLPSSDVSRVSAGAPAATPATSRPGWRVGQAYRYQIDWSQGSVAQSESPLAGLGDELRGNLALEAELRLEPRSATEDGIVVHVALESIRRASVTLQGQDLLADAALRQTLLAPRLVEALLSAEGELLELRLPKDTPELYAQLLEGVLLQMQDTGGKAAGSEERAPDGVFEVHYEPASDGLSSVRTRVRAVRLEALESPCDGDCRVTTLGQALLSYDASGNLVRIEDAQQVTAASPAGPRLSSQLQFAARLSSVITLGAPPPALVAADWGTKAAGQPWESEQTERALLEQRAAGMNIERVLSGLDLMGSLGPEAAPAGLLASTTAFLALHPELLNELAVRFQDPEATKGMKTALLDLLAATGTSDAQRVLCRLLDDVAANEDTEERLHFVQRTMLLEAPEAETVDYLRGRFEQSRASGDLEMELASAHALGAAADRAESKLAREQAKVATESLQAALTGSTEATERVGLLRALGNAGAESSVATILPYTEDEDDRVRAAAAAALRKMPTVEARAALLTLAADADESVQLGAIDALSLQPQTPELEAELARVLASERGTSPRTEGELVTQLARQKHLGPEARAALGAVLARTTDNRLKARVRLVLTLAQRS